MLNTPGDDAHDGDLELGFDGLEPDDGPDPDAEATGPDLTAEAADDCMPLDDDQEQVGYELYSWEAEELDALDEAVHELGLPHEWVSEGYELVVHATDEATIDEILPHFHGAESDEVDDEDDVTPIEVVSDLFAAVTKLRKDPTGAGVADFLDSAEGIGTRPPYGVDEAAWENLVGAVDSLIDGYHAAAGTDVLRNLVHDVFRRVRPLV